MGSIKDNILSNYGVESCVKIIIEIFYFNHEHKNEVCLNNILNHDQSNTLSSYNLVCVCVCLFFKKKKKTILNHDQSSTLSSYNLDRMITGYNIALMYSI